MSVIIPNGVRNFEAAWFSTESGDTGKAFAEWNF